jgi:hypothetical protein
MDNLGELLGGIPALLITMWIGKSLKWRELANARHPQRPSGAPRMNPRAAHYHHHGTLDDDPEDEVAAPLGETKAPTRPPLEDPGALPVEGLTVVVKKAAVIMSYPNGREGFEKDFQPLTHGSLFRLVCSSTNDAEALLFHLAGTGIIMGRDVAVADASEGPLLCCPGINFVLLNDAPSASGSHQPGTWRIYVTRS